MKTEKEKIKKILVQKKKNTKEVKSKQCGNTFEDSNAPTIGGSRGEGVLAM